MLSGNEWAATLLMEVEVRLVRLSHCVYSSS